MLSDFSLKWNLNLPNSQTQSVEGGSPGQWWGGWGTGMMSVKGYKHPVGARCVPGLVCRVVMAFTLCHALTAAGRILWVFFLVPQSNTTENTGGHPLAAVRTSGSLHLPGWKGAQLLHCGRNRTAGSESGLPFPQSAKELFHPLGPWRPCRSLDVHSHPAIMGSTPPSAGRSDRELTPSGVSGGQAGNQAHILRR